MTDPSTSSNPSATLAHELQGVLERQSISKGSFTLASGAHSHYYCDTKATVLSPRGAQLCGRELYALLRDTGAEAVGGLAMGAVYLATAVAIASDEAKRNSASAAHAPLMYGFTVRQQPKDHGTERQIDESWHPDGQLLVPGRKVAVVDDVVTTAGSIMQAIDAIQAIGCEIVGVAAVVDRQAGGAQKIRDRGLAFAALYQADENGDLSPAFGF